MIISERETDTHLYFLRGVLSNFEKCYIKYKGHLFATTEQAFMWEKAVFFNDHESASKILREENPAKAKKLGREVKNFDDSKWSKVCYEIMYLINYEKYFQNTRLKNILLNTGDKMIIEANPKDTRWGIGLSAEDDRVLDESQWQGENLLGKVLMELRKDLK
jgi:ribA/ribD-fused uncharacterized protein